MQQCGAVVGRWGMYTVVVVRGFTWFSMHYGRPSTYSCWQHDTLFGQNSSMHVTSCSNGPWRSATGETNHPDLSRMLFRGEITHYSLERFINKFSFHLLVLISRLNQILNCQTSLAQCTSQWNSHRGCCWVVLCRTVKEKSHCSIDLLGEASLCVAFPPQKTRCFQNYTSGTLPVTTVTYLGYVLCAISSWTRILATDILWGLGPRFDSMPR